MIQGIDVSYSILYDNAKAQKEIQEISNACVSHEMRNPMNSISAINEAKKHMYQKIKQSKNMTEVKELMKELEEIMQT